MSKSLVFTKELPAQKLKVLLIVGPDISLPLTTAVYDSYPDDCLMVINTPLHYASKPHVSPEIIEELLKNKADINALNNYNNTPLHVASIYGDHVAVDELLKNKAEVNISDFDYSV